MTSITEALTMFQAANEARNLKPATLGFYAQQLAPFTAWLSGRGVVELAGVTPALIREYIVMQQRRGLSAASVHAAARSIRAWCNFLEVEGLLAVNPARKVRMPKLPKKIMPALAQDDVRALLRAAANTPTPERDAALVWLLLDAGLRASEVCKLAWPDVDLQRGVLIVRSGKGGKDRIGYIGARCRAALTAWRLLAGADSGLVFGLQYPGLRSLLRRLAAAAGVQVHAHEFRRTFAVELLRSGCDLLRVAKLLGHADLQVVQRYLPLVENDLEAAHRAGSPGDRL